MRPIDVWSVSTFDDVLLQTLNSECALLCNYARKEKQLSAEREVVSRWTPEGENPFGMRRNHFLEQVVMPAMQSRTIRAWHYTRLTDEETGLLRSEGVYVSNLEMIRRRLDAQVSAGLIPGRAADALYAASPFHRPRDTRAGKFWMTSHPAPTDSSGVQPLLEHWGGEGVYFWLEDVELIKAVKSFGRPRVIELAVPLRFTAHDYWAAQAVVAAFVREHGCELGRSAFDLYTTNPLSADAVLGVHTEGDHSFAALARGYP
jgi:hypothetical protein